MEMGLKKTLKYYILGESLKEIEEIWKKTYPDQPFNYWFLDENFAHQYKSEVQFGKVFGFFASINNVFDVTYKTGGFEQSRKATFPDYVADNANGTPSFGHKYFYGFGRTYFVNFYINF
jgi:hypothetical protein